MVDQRLGAQRHERRLHHRLVQHASPGHRRPARSAPSGRPRAHDTTLADANAHRRQRARCSRSCCSPAVGLDLTSDDFRRVGRQPAIVLTGLVARCSYCRLSPWGLAWALQPGPEVNRRPAARRRLSDRRHFEHLQLHGARLDGIVGDAHRSLVPVGGATLPTVGKGLELASNAHGVVGTSPLR